MEVTIKIKQLTLAGLLLVGLSASAQQKKWSLQECVDYALENNITILQVENTILTNEQNVDAANGQFLPSVSGGLGQSLNLGTSLVAQGIFADRTSYATSARINVNQTVFNGFRLTNLYKQSQLNLETSKLELKRIKDDISLNVVNAYLNVLFNIENLEIAKAQYDFSKKQLDQVRELVDAGVQPQANVYDAEATLSSDLQNVTVAENNYELALLSLSQLLQLPYEGFDVEVIELDNPSSELMYKKANPIISYALDNRYEIKVAEKNIENSKLNTEISKSGYYPSVGLSYQFGTNAFFDNSEGNPINDISFFNQLNGNKGHSFGLNVSVPIFSQFQNKTNVAKAKIQEENAQLNLKQAKLDVEANVQRAFADAKAALRAYEAAKSSLESQQIAFQNSQERYDIGAMNAFDLEQSRLRLVNAESSLINAKYDFIFKTKVLDFYLGKPITQ